MKNASIILIFVAATIWIYGVKAQSTDQYGIEPLFDTCDCYCCRISTPAGNETIETPVITPPTNGTAPQLNNSQLIIPNISYPLPDLCTESSRSIPKTASFRLSEFNAALCNPRLCNVNFPAECPNPSTEQGVNRVGLSCSVNNSTAAGASCPRPTANATAGNTGDTATTGVKSSAMKVRSVQELFIFVVLGILLVEF